MTQLDLVNQALSFLKYPTLLSSLDSQEPFARTCKIALEASIPEVIDELPWQECTKTVLLVALDVPDENGLRKYRRPTDLVRALKPSPSEFETEGNFIYAVAEEEISLRYLYNDNLATYGPALQLCIRLKLMSYLAESMLGDSDKSAKHEMAYERQIAKSRLRQMRQNKNQKTYGVESSYTDARRGSLQGFGAFSGLIPEPE
jgi:hypothetical protein